MCVPLWNRTLAKINIPVYIHDVQVKEGFVAEHIAGEAPEDFNSVSGMTSWRPSIRTMVIFILHRMERLPLDRLRMAHCLSKRVERSAAWSVNYSRNYGCLCEINICRYKAFPIKASRTLKSYVFPILSELPYVRRAFVRHPNSQNARSEGLFINRENFDGYIAATSSERGEQACLFP